MSSEGSSGQSSNQLSAEQVDLDVKGLPLDESAQERVKEAFRRALEEELANQPTPQAVETELVCTVKIVKK